jgi:peptidyl-prolyl cis-trans isomerase D
MIQFFKDNISQSIAFKGFLILLVLSFGVWGIGDVITPSVDPGVAIQGDRFEVRVTELQRQYNVQMDNLRQSLGQEIASDPEMKANVLNTTVDRLKQTSIINVAALELGVNVTRDQVREDIMATPGFHDETGAFNQNNFNQVLFNNQLTELAFTKMVEDSLRQQTLLNPVSVNANAPQSLVDKLFAYRAETRIADTLLVPAEAMVIPAAPTDDQIKATYDENIASFTAPEYRTISAVVITRAELVPPESIDDATVRAYYDENANSFRSPEMRKLQQLVFETKEAADAARALMTPGDDLAKIATKAKIDPPVDLGERALNDAVVAPFGDALKLAVNEVSQPIETPLGWHLIQTTAIQAERTTPFEEVRFQVRKTIADEKSQDALYEASEKLEDEVAAGTPFDEAAKAAGGRFVKFDAIDRRGQNKLGSPAYDPGQFGGVAQDKFIQLAFATESGRESDLKDFDGGFYMLKVESITPPAPKPMDAMRPEIVKLWQTQERVKVAKAEAEKIAASLSPSVTLTALADKDKRLLYAKLGPLTRFGESLTRDYVVDSKRVGPEMLDKLFNAKVGDSFTATVQGGYIVARVQQIVPGKAEGELAAAMASLQNSTREAMTNDLLQQFTTALADRYPVKLNGKAIAEIAGVPQEAVRGAGPAQVDLSFLDSVTGFFKN